MTGPGHNGLPLPAHSTRLAGARGGAMLLRRVTFPDFCEPCLPSPAAKPPVGAAWLHEIKHDGFRMLVRRDAAGVRLFTRSTPLLLEFPLH